MQDEPRFQTASEVAQYAAQDGWMELSDYGVIVNWPSGIFGQMHAVLDHETGHVYAVSESVLSFQGAKVDTLRAGSALPKVGKGKKKSKKNKK